MTTTFLLARHGRTAWNADGRAQGHADIPLDDLGRAQAERLGAALSGRGIVAVFSSDLRRARETAEAVARPYDLPVHEDPRLREMNLGAADGLPVELLAGRFPDVMRAWKEDPGPCRFPEGESLLETQARVEEVLAEISAQFPDGTVAIVAHGFALLATLCKALSLPLNEFRRLWLEPTGLSELHRSPGRRPSVRRINDTGHLLGLIDPSPETPPSA